MDQIFVQIASYRDAELPLTIKSALAMAKYPERLRFGICWQFDKQTYLDLDPYINDPRFRIAQTSYKNSKGCCWARNQTNLLYQDEKYTLQIDAHMRFAQDWDVRFISMLGKCDSEKPILSTYPAPYYSDNGVEHLADNHGMQRLILNRMRRDLTTIFKAELVEDRSKPAPSKFLAAGQLFTLGRFCKEVEYDPDLYYSGEEISLSARAYSQGYDMFCPNEDLLWHLYQHSMPVHGSDHVSNQHESSMDRLQKLFIEDHTKLGKYGFGSKRSLAEYEAYAKLDFKGCMTRNPQPCRFNQTLSLNLNGIEQRDDYDLWIFTLRDIDDQEIYRRDLSQNEIPSYESPILDVDAELSDTPVSYGIWPRTADGHFFPSRYHDLQL